MVNRKVFIACDYNHSRQENQYPTYRPHHMFVNPTLRSSLNMMFSMLEPGSPMLESLFLKTIEANRANLARVKWRCILVRRIPKRLTHRESHGEAHQKFFHRIMWRNGYVSLHRTWFGNELMSLGQPNSTPTKPRSTKTIYVKIWNPILTMMTNNECLLFHQRYSNLS